MRIKNLYIVLLGLYINTTQAQVVSPPKSSRHLAQDLVDYGLYPYLNKPENIFYVGIKNWYHLTHLNELHMGYQFSLEKTKFNVCLNLSQLAPKQHKLRLDGMFNKVINTASELITGIIFEKYFFQYEKGNISTKDNRLFQFHETVQLNVEMTATSWIQFKVLDPFSSFFLDNDLGVYFKLNKEIKNRLSLGCQLIYKSHEKLTTEITCRLEMPKGGALFLGSNWEKEQFQIGYLIKLKNIEMILHAQFHPLLGSSESFYLSTAI